jgi:hypothetical protein
MPSGEPKNSRKSAWRKMSIDFKKSKNTIHHLYVICNE